MLTVQLESFLMVAATSSVSLAARRLYLTQPAVTKQVRALEQALGVKLLERTARGVRLTDAGELVRDYGRRSAALVEECRSALGELTLGKTGKLSIGAGVTTSTLQLPDWLGRYRRRWPDVDVRIHTGDSRAVSELVHAREVDCGFVTSEIRHPELHAQPLYRERILLVAAPSADFRARVELSQVPLIVFPAHTGFRRYLERAWSQAQLDARIHMEIDSVEATKSLVAVGLGCAFLPELAVQQELKSGRLQQLTVRGLSPLRRQTLLLRRRDRRPSRALANFLTLLPAASPARR